MNKCFKKSLLLPLIFFFLGSLQYQLAFSESSESLPNCVTASDLVYAGHYGLHQQWHIENRCDYCVAGSITSKYYTCDGEGPDGNIFFSLVAKTGSAYNLITWPTQACLAGSSGIEAHRIECPPPPPRGDRQHAPTFANCPPNFILAKDQMRVQATNSPGVDTKQIGEVDLPLGTILDGSVHTGLFERDTHFDASILNSQVNDGGAGTNIHGATLEGIYLNIEGSDPTYTRWAVLLASTYSGKEEDEKIIQSKPDGTIAVRLGLYADTGWQYTLNHPGFVHVKVCYKPRDTTQ